MKKRKFTVQHLLSGMMALLGFSACNSETPCLYGTPSADYKVMGTVTDEDGNPIEGIQVVVVDSLMQDNYIQKGDSYVERSKMDTVYTDKQGKYASRDIQTFGTEEVEVVFNDVDESANGGLFVRKELSVKELKSNQVEKGDGSFYKGRFELTGDVVMERLD